MGGLGGASDRFAGLAHPYALASQRRAPLTPLPRGERGTGILAQIF
jgi:hypothetical protein